MNEYNNRQEEEYEPTTEEWQEIEELILQEEIEEENEYKHEKAQGLNEFKQWCKENGMIW